jgi:hypothetical protein
MAQEDTLPLDQLMELARCLEETPPQLPSSLPEPGATPSYQDRNKRLFLEWVEAHQPRHYPISASVTSPGDWVSRPLLAHRDRTWAYQRPQDNQYLSAAADYSMAHSASRKIRLFPDYSHPPLHQEGHHLQSFPHHKSVFLGTLEEVHHLSTPSPTPPTRTRDHLRHRVAIQLARIQEAMSGVMWPASTPRSFSPQDGEEIATDPQHG